MCVGIYEKRWLGEKNAKSDDTYVLEVENDTNLRGLTSKIVLMSV